ncbi:MAG: PRC-barrel domain-containing protein [Gemmatimonadetes bacterium]|nr:PRC-barrel domain-containing protein [Gemmatimonadota bacterium]
MTKNTSEKKLDQDTPFTSSAPSKGETPVPASARSTSGMIPGLTSTLVAGRDVRGFRLTPPMFDVRGWDAMLDNGIKLGTVDRIMLDIVSKTPRYLAIKPTDRTGHLLVPIGFGRLEQAARQVVLNGLSPDALQKLPILTSEGVTTAFERQCPAVTGSQSRRLPCCTAVSHLISLYDPDAVGKPNPAAMVLRPEPGIGRRICASSRSSWAARPGVRR